MASNRPSHQVSQLIAATKLEETPVPTATDPKKENNLSPTGPNNSLSTNGHRTVPTTTVTSVSLPIPVQADSQDQGSSLSFGYQNPSSSSPLTTHGAQSTQFSQTASVPSPQQNQVQASGLHERSPLNQQSHRQLDLKQSSPNNVFIPVSAHLQQDKLPPNQFGHLQPQNQDDRQNSATNRFANLLNVSNTATAQYPSLVPQPQVVHSEQFLPPGAHQGSHAQPTTNEPPLAYRTLREDQSGQNPRYNHSGMATPQYQASHAQNKLFEGIEQMEKQDSQLLQSQTPSHNQQFQGHEEQIRRQVQNPTRQRHQTVQQWQRRLQQSNSLPQHSQALYSAYPHQNGYQVPMGSQSQFHGIEHGHLRDSAFEAANKYRGVGAMRTLQNESSTHMNGFRPLPSARSLQHSNGFRPVNVDGRGDSSFRAENGMDMSGRARTMANGISPHGRDQSSGSHGMGLSWELIREAVKAYQSPENATDREEFLNTYLELLKSYDENCDAVYDAVDTACVGLITNSRVPYMLDTITAPVDDETPEDAQQKLIVKRKFVEAMERLQGDQLPTKRRGNLPKESTAYLKRWFDQHYDHPCKFLRFLSCALVISLQESFTIFLL